MLHKRNRMVAAVLSFFQAGLILLWLLLLRDTDSYWSVYVLCAGVGLICLWSNSRRTTEISWKERMVLVLFSAVFSVAVVLANYALFLTLPGLQKLIRAGGVGLGGSVLAWQILLWGVKRLPVPTRKFEAYNGGFVFFLCFGLLSGLFLLYFFTTAFPGYYTPDSFNSLMQIRSGVYVNNHPFWYTMLIKLLTGFGDALFESTNAAMAVYHVGQILILAASMAFALLTLYQAGCPRWGIVTALIGYGLLPYNIAFSVTMWKDIPFSAAILVTITALYRILKNIGRAKKGNYIMLALGAAGMCLMRTNGLALCAVTALMLLLVTKGQKKKLLLLMAVILVVCWILTGPILDSMAVGETDFVEVLAVPFQQVARVITNGYALQEETYVLLNEIFDLERIPQVYTHESVDPIKQIAFHQDRREYLRENLGIYGRLWLQLGLEHPGEYLKAWIELTKGYWNGGYEYWIYHIGGMNEELGITRMTQTNWLGSLFNRYFVWVDNAVFLQPLVSIGLHVWALVACCVVNCLKKRQELLLTIPLLVLVVGLWLGTPVFSEFRYAYPIFLSMPLILGVTAFGEQNTQPE